MAYSLGYRTIDEIGRERIRRAAAKIKEETGADIDYGFKTYSIENINDDILTNLYDFVENIKLIKEDTVACFDTAYARGKDAILSTYLLLDGYGLGTKTTPYQLKNYVAEKIEKSLYIIEAGLESGDVMELIRKIETLELDIRRIVVYGNSTDFTVANELKTNLANLRNNKSVELIERF